MFASPFSCTLCMYVLEAFFFKAFIYSFLFNIKKNEMVEKKKYKKFSEFFSSSFYFVCLASAIAVFLMPKMYNIKYIIFSISLFPTSSNIRNKKNITAIFLPQHSTIFMYFIMLSLKKLFLLHSRGSISINSSVRV